MAPLEDETEGKMNSLDKMLSVLNGFNEDNLMIDVAQAAELSGSSRASAYRYLQALTRSGLLTPASGGSYVIGSRVIELEMLKRENDPLLRAARYLIRYYADCMGMNIMLCSYYGDKVLCADNAWPDHSIPEMYKPGRSMPIFKGAMAKVILANLSSSQLKSIHSWNAERIRESGLGETLEEFLARMAEIRSAGVTITQGEVVDGLVGIAAPIRDGEERVLGSVVFVLSIEHFNSLERDALAQEIRHIASEIEHGILRASRFAATAPTAAARPRRVPVYRG